MSQPAAKARPSLLDEAADLAKTLAWVLLFFLAIRSLAVEPFMIPSSSMEPGLVTGDYIWVSKFDYGWSRASLPFNPPIGRGRLLNRAPRRGDVVVFRRPSDPSQTWIKRVIGLPGDRVQVAHGVVWVNGVAISQQVLGLTRDHDSPGRPVMTVEETLPSGRSYRTYDAGVSGEDDTNIYVTPPGCYFVMGDNRDDSADSRFLASEGVGFLPAENLFGKARWIMLSWGPGVSPFRPWTVLTRLQPSRFLQPIR